MHGQHMDMLSLTDRLPNHLLQPMERLNIALGSTIMKNYIDVLILWNSQESKDFISIMKEFGTQMSGWKFLEEQSEDYSTITGNPSCMLLKDDNKFKPAVAVTLKTGNIFYIANIVPKETSYLSMTEYNEVAKQFANDVKLFVKNKKLSIKIKTINENIRLPDIISSSKARALFERYLNHFPTSYHLYDIERLDVFTCAVFRYSRTKVDIDLLKSWLIKDKKWSEKDAAWTVNRIETGLSVLKINKKF